MAELDAERVIQILGEKVAQGVQREAIHQAYTEQLEKQIQTLQEQLRGGTHVAEERNPSTTWEANPG